MINKETKKNYIEEINKHFTLTHVHGNNNAFGYLIKNQFSKNN